LNRKLSDSENIVDFQIQNGSEEESDELNGKVYSEETEESDNSDYSENSEDSEDSEDSENSEHSESPDNSEDSEESHGTPLGSLRGVFGNKTLEDVIEREAKEEQDTSSPFSLSRTLGGAFISRFIRRQIGVVLLIGAFIIIYISLRYMCQKKLVEIDKTESKIVNARYKATVCTSQLTEASRESNVLKRLAECGDSTLTIADEPPYLIKIEEK
jgi:hypothetical protein